MIWPHCVLIMVFGLGKEKNSHKDMVGGREEISGPINESKQREKQWEAKSGKHITGASEYNLLWVPVKKETRFICFSLLLDWAKFREVKNNERPKVANTNQGRRNITYFEGPVKKEQHFILFSDRERFMGVQTAHRSMGSDAPVDTNQHTHSTHARFLVHVPRNDVRESKPTTCCVKLTQL